jgi:pimeloyl-ACP methyl ester carboxylesterase/class 3 adenylate cyclase
VVPRTRYTRSGDVHIGYQVSGEGPPDIVYVHGYGSNQDVQWEEPRFAHFLRRLAAMGRLATFDKRGTGVSDRLAYEPALEERADDIRAVMDAVGLERATLVATTGGGPPAMLFAATTPDRVDGLVLYGTSPRTMAAPDWPWGQQPDDLDAIVSGSDTLWGTGITAPLYAPSLDGDRRFRDWAARYERSMVSQGAAADLARVNNTHDLRAVLPAIRAPTLVLVREEDMLWIVAGSRYLAEHIRGARLVELPGRDHWPFVGDADGLLDEIQDFVTGARPTPASARVLTTVLFTDLVGSTRHAAELGDRRWRALLDSHDEIVRTEVERLDGRPVKSTGDGALATFDGPARGVRSAFAIRDGLAALGLEMRAGVHTGEVEVRGDDVGGIAVHVAARVAGLAGAGEVLATSTVRDLTAGSGLTFEDRGATELRGLDGEWHLVVAGEATGRRG